MIYIVKHITYPNPVPKGFKEIYVGDIYKGDNPTMNYLNPYLNEVTALYDLRSFDDEYLGLVHYRRLFKGLTYDRAKEILDDYDVITTTDYEPMTPYFHLANALGEEVVTKYVGLLPQKIEDWFYSHQAFNICNMFVAKNQFVKDYGDWLFPIILPMTERFLMEDKTNDFKHNRTIGFITECLFGYYCKDFKRYKVEIEEWGYQ